MARTPTKPWLYVLAILLLLLALYSYRQLQLRSLIPFGAPQTEQFEPFWRYHILLNPGFAVGYSEALGNPLWVSYQLSAGPRYEADFRSRPFRSDWRTWRHIGPDDFRNSGYDRGHMAPNYALAVMHGPQAQRAGFLMSNVSPQTPVLNRLLWQRLEEAAADQFLQHHPNIHVLTGPVFSSSSETRLAQAALPEAFYKIFLVPGNTPKVLAFLMPQQVQGDEPLSDYLTSVDNIENLTGLDFFPQLPQTQQLSIESQIDSSGWGLEKIDQRPPRYRNSNKNSGLPH